MLGERVRRTARRKRGGQRQTHITGRLNEQTSREILSDGPRVKTTDGFQCLTGKNGVRSSVDDAVARRLRHLDSAVEIILLVGNATFRIQAMLEHVRIVEALWRLKQAELDLLIRGQSGIASLRIDEVRDGLHQETPPHDHVGIQRHHIRCARTGHGGIEVAGLGALVIRPVEIAYAHTIGQSTHLRATVVVAQPDMHLGCIGIFQVLASVDGLDKQVVGLVVGGDEDIDIRVFLRLACR